MPTSALRNPKAAWLILACYCATAATTQVLWLSYAAIDTKAASTLGVDVSAVGDLALIMPLAYILFAIPCGRWLDRRFELALGCGAGLTALGGLIRVTSPASFAVQCLGQCVIAIGQPLVLNALTEVSTRYFPAKQRSLVISAGTASLFVGILISVLAGDPLFANGGLHSVLAFEALPTVVIALALIACLAKWRTAVDRTPVVGASTWMFHDRLMLPLAGLVLIGMGTYNGIATWLQPILDKYGEGDAAGNLVAIMTGAGILGAATLAPWAAHANRRRRLLFGSLGMSVLALAAMSLRHQTPWIGGWLAAEGLLLMASLPVVLDWSEMHAGPHRQAVATGFLLMAGNVGGLLIPGLMQVVLDQPAWALLLLSIVAACGLPLVMRLPATVARPTSR